MLPHQSQIITTISYFTEGWIQNLLTNLRQHLPTIPILVVDNNPDPHEQHWNRNYHHHTHHTPSVAAERHWLHQQTNLLLTKQPNRHNLTHGHALDHAKQWCQQHHIHILTHIEPDCIFPNTNWYPEQITAIHQGYYVAGNTHRHPRVPTPNHVCCTTYYLPFITNLTFEITPNTTDKTQPEYQQLIAPNYPHNYWDTGEKIWYEAAKIHRYKRTNPHGLTHTHQGSLHPYDPIRHRTSEGQRTEKISQ